MTDRTDNFNRADEDPLNVPSDGGSAWVEQAGTGWLVSSNVAKYPNVVSVIAAATLESSVTDAIVQATFTVVGSSPNSDQGLTARLVDGSNWVHVMDRRSSGTVFLRKVVATSHSTIASTVTTISAGDVITLEVTSSHNWTVKLNTTSIITANDSANSSGTKHGLYSAMNSGPDNMAWDDFSITGIGGGGAAAQMFLLNPVRFDGLGHGGIFPGNRVMQRLDYKVN